MDPGVDPWCLTGPPLPRLLRTYEDARVCALTLHVWREVCWPHGSLLGLLSAARQQQVRGSRVGGGRGRGEGGATAVSLNAPFTSLLL
jgi:hypothetical protein